MQYPVDDLAVVPPPATPPVTHRQERLLAATSQKRSPDRRLFPDCWGMAGGLLEPGETLLDTLVQEAEQDAGWRLRRIRRLIGIAIWTGGGGTRHEADYLVEVGGGLDHPVLEWSKHTAYECSDRRTFLALRRTEPLANTSSTT
jgi:8-oxo-dGTP pyrophosphatase MutT (NUDIX family)